LLKAACSCEQGPILSLAIPRRGRGGVTGLPLAAKIFPEYAAAALLCLAQVATADTNPPLQDAFVCRAWGTEAGLPQNTVNTIVQTHDGYLWLGTQGGLARFDGVRFAVYGLTHGLPSVQVRALCEDGEGNLWIGTGGGLCRMRDGRFENFTAENGLAGINVTAIARGNREEIWVGTADGLNLWRRGKFVQPEALASWGRPPIRSLLTDRHGAIWIGSNQGLFELKDENLVEALNPADGQSITSAYCLLEDSAGNIWVGIGNGRILCRRDNKWASYDESAGVPYAYTTCLAEGVGGTIWAGSLDQGLHNFHDGKFWPVQDGLSGQAIRSLFADREGNLWVGMRTSGLNRVVRRRLTIIGPAQGLTNDFVRSVTESADGTLWAATTGGGIYRGAANHFEVVPTTIGNVTYPFMESVLATRDGSVWWGGAPGSLFQWKDGQLAISLTGDKFQWLRNSTVTALLEDRVQGLWIGTVRGIIVKYREGVATLITNRVARGAVSSLVQEPDGSLWIGSVAGGLCRLGGDGAMAYVTNGLLGIYVAALHLDKENTLWIGTGGGGLNRWKNGKMTSFTTRQGLSDDTISQILEDDAGNLWLGCNRGIFRVRKSELNELAEGEQAFVHPRGFGINDGMLAEECSSGSWPPGLKTKSGQLCFSTVRGLVLIDPGQTQFDEPPPGVALEEVLANGQLQTLPPRSALTDDEENPSLALTLPPGLGEIEIHYTGLSFAAPQQIRFRYRLDGLDKDWSEAATRRAAYFHRLPPGEFVFHVSACNADGVWSRAAALKFAVLPHFWETGWFPVTAGTALLAGTIGLVSLAVRGRYKRRLARLEMQHAVERERLRISQDMHDDIGGILTRVSIMSDVGESAPDGNETARGQFGRIGKQVRSAVQSLDEIVWATNPKNDNLRRFADYVGLFADEFFENTPVRCWQEIPTDLPEQPLRADVRHDIFLAVKEAFNNVLKHSEATEVWLRLTVEARFVRLAIDDNGRGFRPAAVAGNGSGLNNMQERLTECGGKAEILSAPLQGTKIRFTFPLSPN
jgi:ligand-binding sensor domain-containing protein/signal transduction histidine kinase